MMKLSDDRVTTLVKQSSLPYYESSVVMVHNYQFTIRTNDASCYASVIDSVWYIKCSMQGKLNIID
jgi:hypothetical protein